MNPRPFRLRALLPLLAFFVCVSLASGCYTTLRHPGTPDLPNDYSYREKSCYDCHDEAAFYHSFYGVHFNYYHNSPWFGYYSDPWWYDTYWHGGLRGAPVPERYDDDERHNWMRGSPSGSHRGSYGSPSQAPYLRPDYSGKPSKPSRPPEEVQKKQKEEDDQRHTGRRGKKKK